MNLTWNLTVTFQMSLTRTKTLNPKIQVKGKKTRNSYKNTRRNAKIIVSGYQSESYRMRKKTGKLLSFALLHFPYFVIVASLSRCFLISHDLTSCFLVLLISLVLTRRPLAVMASTFHFCFEFRFGFALSSVLASVGRFNFFGFDFVMVLFCYSFALGFFWSRIHITVKRTPYESYDHLLSYRFSAFCVVNAILILRSRLFLFHVYVSLSKPNKLTFRFTTGTEKFIPDSIRIGTMLLCC